MVGKTKQVKKTIKKLVKKINPISTNKILFRKLDRSEKRYRDLFENASDGLVFFDVKNKCFKESNLAINKISGYTKKELKQLPFLELFFSGDREKVENIVNAIRNKNKTVTLPLKFYSKIITKNNKIKITKIEIGTQVNENEICFNFHDITKSKLAEEENIRLKEFNQKIIDASPVSILVLNKTGDIILANGMAKKLMKKLNQKQSKINLLKTGEIKENKKLKEKYKKLLQSGEPLSYDNLFYVSKIDKKKKCLNIIAVPLYNKDKKVNGAISMAIDNTEKVMVRKKLEEVNKNLEKTVKNRTQELDKINKELGKVLELKSKFISDASHELRTPLTIIHGNLDLAIQEARNKEKQIPEAYILIEKEVEQMTGILADLTMLTNTDASSETIDCDKIDLDLLIKTVGQSLKILANKKRIKIKIIRNKELVPVFGDEAKLEKLFLNIVRNAIKYTEKNGKIGISTKKNNGIAEVIIKDTGIGIPEQDLPYIFERFYRVDKARSRAEGGTGLGLSICKWIAEAHRGSIKVKSKLGTGSVFTVSLPCECQCKDK